MTESINPDDRRTEIALARYTLILPIVRETSRRQRHQMRKNIAATIHDFSPGVRRGVSVTTLYRWEKAYRQGGFDALKPQARHDKECRAISSETLDRAEALKREQPFRSARAIINILQMDTNNPIPETELSERTLRRQLVKRSATTAQLAAEQQPKPYRRFERNAFGDLWQGDALHGPYLPDPAAPDSMPLFSGTKNERSSSSPLSTITPAWFLTLSSTGTSSYPAWKIASSVLSAAMARPWRFTLIEARSTSRNSSIPLALRWGFNVFWLRLTTPKGKGKSNVSLALSAPTFCPNLKLLT